MRDDKNIAHSAQRKKRNKHRQKDSRKAAALLSVKWA
jgi:hypothetical protein